MLCRATRSVIRRCGAHLSYTPAIVTPLVSTAPTARTATATRVMASAASGGVGAGGGAGAAGASAADESATTATAASIQPLEYLTFMTKKARARKPSAIRKLMPHVSKPGMISLGGGMPNASTFPFVGMSLTLNSGDTIQVSPTDLKAGLQYSPTPGLAPLVERLRRMQVIEHSPGAAADGLLLSITNGSQDGLAKAFDMFLDESSSILVETPTYSGVLAYLEPIGCNLVSVPIDDKGLRADALAAVLDSWDVAKRGAKPKVLYTVPTGANPSGRSQDLERKKAVYEIACKNNLIIMEDDPYYYLQFGATRVPSYLSLDTQGRVLRFDSFSKILSSGIRMGFVTGPEPLVTQINLHSQASCLHASGISQTLVLAYLRHIGAFATTEASAMAPFDAHVASVVEFYRNQRDAAVAAAKKHLAGRVEFVVPDAGMFLWMKLLDVKDSSRLIEEEAVKQKVLMVPGVSFIPGGTESPYVRAAFSVATPENIDIAMQRLASVLDDAKASNAKAT